MNSNKKTNYEVHKDYIAMKASEALPVSTAKREVCKSLCKEKGIDPAKQTPPCYEAWIEWADMEVK